jgi:hypothetical protein
MDKRSLEGLDVPKASIRTPRGSMSAAPLKSDAHHRPTKKSVLEARVDRLLRLSETENKRITALKQRMEAAIASSDAKVAAFAAQVGLLRYELEGVRDTEPAEDIDLAALANEENEKVQMRTMRSSLSVPPEPLGHRKQDSLSMLPRALQSPASAAAAAATGSTVDTASPSMPPLRMHQDMADAASTASPRLDSARSILS